MLTLKKIHIFSSLYTQLFSAISQVDKLAQVKNSSDSFFLAGKFFGFDTPVEEAQQDINAAHVESERIENGIGVVKLIGHYSGKLYSFNS